MNILKDGLDPRAMRQANYDSGYIDTSHETRTRIFHYSSYHSLEDLEKECDLNPNQLIEHRTSEFCKVYREELNCSHEHDCCGCVYEIVTTIMDMIGYKMIVINAHLNY